jgi:RNA-directed DNA polymerase
VVDADLKSYFDTIPHDRLMTELRQRIADGRVLGLIEAFLKAKVMNGLEEWEPAMGSPQGAVLSPLLSNVFLNPVDHAMAAAGFEMVRYADDFVILCRSREEAERALAYVRQQVEDRGLTLHPDKTRLVDLSQAGEFEFLGYHFKGKDRWPRRQSLNKLKDKIRAHTKRTSGLSLEAIIQNLNPVLRGWFNYFQHSNRHTFPALDGWVRMRLRSILRKRQGLRGRGRGADHQRWPNAFFAGHRLFDLTTARYLAWPLR